MKILLNSIHVPDLAIGTVIVASIVIPTIVQMIIFNTEIMFALQSRISKNSDILPIFQNPSEATFKLLFYFPYARPYETGINSFFSMKNMTFREIPGLYNRATSDAGFQQKFQICLPIRATLNPWRSRKPKPPLLFGNDILSHPNHLMPLLFLSLDFHQYSFIIRSISTHNDFGIRKQDIIYDEIDWATLIRYTFGNVWFIDVGDEYV